MDLIINDKKIDAPIIDVVNQVRDECFWSVFRVVDDRGEYLRVTCPFHKGGEERRPSCSIYASYDSDSVQPGFCHCFACGVKLPIYSWIGRVFGYDDDEFGKEWLVARFGNTFLQKKVLLPEISLNKQQTTYVPEIYLLQFAYTHPYMYKRKLSDAIINKFQIGYDAKNNAITFPLRDRHGGLLGVSERSVSTKYFSIPGNIKKPVYLLDTVIREGYTSTIICESQIDALYAWSCGYVACALIGTGSEEQYSILNTCPIRHYVLMFDGDAAGQAGAKKFLRNIRKDVIVDVCNIPNGKDLNDLNKLELDSLLASDGLNNSLRVNS